MMMKYLFYLIFAFSLNAISQTNSTLIIITDDLLLIVSSSTEYEYSGNNYFNYQKELLTARQNKYDYNHSLLTNELGRLTSLKLVNESNNKIVKHFQETIPEGVRTNCMGDLSIDSYANECIKYAQQTFDIESIRIEIKLLQKINSEINYLKTSDINYKNSLRYLELANLLNELKTCSNLTICELAFKYKISDISCDIIESDISTNISNTNENTVIKSNPKILFYTNEELLYVYDMSGNYIGQLTKTSGLSLNIKGPGNYYFKVYEGKNQRLKLQETYSEMAINVYPDKNTQVIYQKSQDSRNTYGVKLTFLPIK